MRLIDADALKARLELDKQIQNGSMYAGIMSYIIDSTPTVDAVPVVRCKDCKHAHLTYEGDCKYCQLDIDRGLTEATYRDGDWFCADGERKDKT